MVKQSNKNTVKHASIGYNFSNGVQVTDHFIERAQERFGVRDLHDKDKNRQYTESWATELLSDYEILEEQDDVYLLKCKEIVIVWSRTEKVCITCYSMQYNKYTKNYDTLATTITKRKLQLDNYSQKLVDETFESIWYNEFQQDAGELAELHKKLSDLYTKVNKAKTRITIDKYEEDIIQCNSITQSLEDKLQNVRNVTLTVTK